MGLFIDAIASNEVTYDKGAIEVDTSYNLGDGFHKVKTTGTGTNITVGKGDTLINSKGSDCNINAGEGYKKIKAYGNSNTIVTDSGDDDVIFIGNNSTINLGEGDIEIAFVGINNNITMGKGNDNIVLWGDNCNIKTGDGDDTATTLDQVYTTPKYNELAEDFIDTLRTGTWEDWKRRTSDLIDVKVDQNTFRTKTTYVYERHYDVYTYFSRYIDGVKNTTIDMGDGKDKANVTLETSSTVSTTKTNMVEDDTVIKNQKWQIDELTDVRDEVKIEKETKKKTNWAGIALTTLAVIAGAATCGFGIGAFFAASTWICASAGALGAIMTPIYANAAEKQCDASGSTAYNRGTKLS